MNMMFGFVLMNEANKNKHGHSQFPWPHTGRKDIAGADTLDAADGKYAI
jgi:hypothetical protein